MYDFKAHNITAERIAAVIDSFIVGRYAARNRMRKAPEVSGAYFILLRLIAMGGYCYYKLLQFSRVECKD